jgi:hypothetical protein
MDLLSNRETPVAQKDTPQLLITPAIDKDGAVATLPIPAVIQHAVPIPVTPKPPGKPPRPLTALIPVPLTASLRRDGRERTRTSFYKPHDIRAVSEAIRVIMDRDNSPPPIFQTDNDAMPSDTDIMRSDAVDTLFDSEYYTGDTEENRDYGRPPCTRQRSVHRRHPQRGPQPDFGNPNLTTTLSHNCTQWIQ